MTGGAHPAGVTGGVGAELLYILELLCGSQSCVQGRNAQQGV